MRRVTQVIAILIAALLFGVAVSIVFAQGPRGMRCAIVHPVTSGTLAADGEQRPFVLIYFHRGIGDTVAAPPLPDALYCMRVPRHLDTLPRSELND